MLYARKSCEKKRDLPMVDGSELAFRMLCRAHGVCAAYTPMIRASKIPGLLLDSPRVVPEDRPLILQLCGRTAVDTFAAAASLLLRALP